MVRQVPNVPANIDNPTLRNFLSAVREALNTAVSDIASGNVSATNAAITADALGAVSSNLANLLDTTVPPKPTGFTVTGIFTTNFLHWDLPNYANYNFAEVWRISAVDGSGNLIPVSSVSLANAILVGTSNGNIYTDPVDAGAKYYYWIRFISGANVAGPYNAVDGTLGATSESVNDVLTNNNWKVAVENLIAVTAWIRSADILNGSITNAKISGAIYSDNYNGNTGFYLDKSGGTVNLNQLTVRDAAGNVILQSSAGGIDFGKVIGATKPANNATRNVFQGNWSTGINYQLGDIVIDADGNGWSALADHTSVSSNKPPSYPGTSSNTWWTIYAIKGHDAISAILSNETHVFPASNDGSVSSYANSGTTIYLYEGTKTLAYDGAGISNGTWKLTTASSNITVGSLTDSGDYVTVGQHSGVSSSTDTSIITYTITGKRFDGTVFTLTASQTFSKSKAGATGATGANGTNGTNGINGMNGATGPQGPSVIVTSDRQTAFTATDGNLDGSQPNIIFTANVSGVSNPGYVWTFSGFQTAPVDSGSANLTVTAVQFGTAKSAKVTCTVNGVYVDDVTIVRLEKSTAAAGATVGATFGINVSGQMDASNISTYMANAAIGKAQMGSASVDTLQLAGQAVTIPASVTAASVAVSGLTTILTITFTSTGNPINISYGGQFFGWVLSSNTGVYWAECYNFYLYRDGTQLAGYANVPDKVNGNYKDTPGAGTFTYTIKAQRAYYSSLYGSGGLQVFNPYLIIMEVKR